MVVDERLTEASIVVTTQWDSEDPGDAGGARLARHVLGKPDAEGWVTAHGVALHGYVLDLAEPVGHTAELIRYHSDRRARDSTDPEAWQVLAAVEITMRYGS